MGREDNDKLRNAINVFGAKLEHMNRGGKPGGKPGGQGAEGDGIRA